VAKCSFKRKYWNFEMEQQEEFECENDKQPESDKCIFHDEHFLDTEENCKIIQEKPQKY